MEYCSEGDLSLHIKAMAKKNKYFNEKVILNWIIQLIIAIEFIHTRKVLHRDIKTSNIFMTSCGTVKIGDFGISK